MTNRVRALALLFAATAGAAQAQSIIPDSRSGGKLLLTGGVSTIEGSGGGGLSTRAVVTGYGEEDGIGGNAHVTVVDLPDYQFRTAGLAVGLWDRVELSVARQDGGCTYSGRSMQDAHDEIGLQPADMGVLVEHLQDAMDAEGVPFRMQNRFLAKLAPMRRDLVTR